MSVVSLPSKFMLPYELSGLPEDTPILVGLSGGADSVSLLHMLCAYRTRFGAPIYAAHVHHGIRGEEADRDEEFCKSVAQRLGVEIFVLHADVPKAAKESHESVETAARRIRYRYFDTLMQEHNIPLLVTAHNADDNLETMLFHLVRGSGLSGLCGIPVSRLCDGGALVRPLLSMTKKEILAYVKEHQLSFVTDSTNTDTDYTRNKIRAELIPALLSLNSSAVEHASHLADTLRADELCLQSMCNLFLEEFRDGFSIETEKLNGSPDAIVNRALLSLYREISDGESLSFAHVNAIKKLSERAVPHSALSLPNGFEAVIENKRLELRKTVVKETIPPYRIPLVEGQNKISQTNAEIIICPSQNAKNIYKKSILFSFDSATINGMPFVRNREAGDTILLCGMHKSLKKLLCEKKIPPELRERLPILCDDDGILAVPLIGQRDGTKGANDDERSVTFIFNL